MAGASCRAAATATGKAVKMLEGHSESLTAVAFSADSRRIASGRVDKAIKVWDTVTGKAVSTLEGHLAYVYLAYLVASSPDSIALHRAAVRFSRCGAQRQARRYTLEGGIRLV